MSHRRNRHAVLRGQHVDPGKLERAKEMRRCPTPGEAAAWDLLRSRRLDGLKWRRQQVISGFIVDFYCAEHRIVLEIDGDFHDRTGAAEADEERAVVFAREGIRAIRIRNEAVSRANLRAAVSPHLLGATPPLP